MDAVRKDVELLVKKEIESANKMFPLFRSRHEGAAVLFEEIQETEEEMEKISEWFKCLWIYIRNDKKDIMSPKKIKTYAISMAVEAIQVAAMAQKFIDSEETRMEEKSCKE